MRARRMAVIVGSVPDLERGRQLFAQADWRDAHDALTAADLVTRLPATDLELLARAAYMLGRDDDYVSALERRSPTGRWDCRPHRCSTRDAENAG